MWWDLRGEGKRIMNSRLGLVTYCVWGHPGNSALENKNQISKQTNKIWIERGTKESLCGEGIVTYNEILILKIHSIRNIVLYLSSSWRSSWFSPPSCQDEISPKKTLPSSYLEEGHCWAISDRSIFYLRLFCQIVSGIDGRFHPLYCQEGSQVGSIGWNDD